MGAALSAAKEHVEGERHESAEQPGPLTILDRNMIRTAYRISWLANFYSGSIYRDLELEFGLTRPEFITLFCLVHQPGATAQDIRLMTGRPKNSISRAVNRLVRDGRIGRSPDPTNHRAALLHMTPAGQKLFDDLIGRFQEREAAMLAPLSAAERAQLDRLLGRLVHRDDGWAKPY